MIRDKILVMTPVELNDEIIKLSGLQQQYPDSTKVVFANWSTNVYAMWRLEEGIPKEQRHKYIKHLNWVLNQNPEFSNQDTRWEFAHASPENRCRAYLIWKEEE